MFEVYLIARVRWARLMLGVAVEPCGPFKIGYSRNPPSRLEQLRSGVPFNLMLVGVLQGFQTTEAAERAEAVMLMQARKLFPMGRGEWIDGDPMLVWAEVFAPSGGLLLNTRMSVDLDRAPLIPFPKTAWPDKLQPDGPSTAFHAYLEARGKSQ